MATPDTPGPDSNHQRPDGVSDLPVEALGKLSEAEELFRKAGHPGIADRLATEIIGRNVIEGRWTFQIVEDYDDNYFSEFKSFEKEARDSLVGGKRHLFEAEMKEDRRTKGRAHHRALPPED